MKNIEPNDVSKIAWAICDKNGLPNEMVKVVSNILWGLIYPEKEHWKNIPQRTDN